MLPKRSTDVIFAGPLLQAVFLRVSHPVSTVRLSGAAGCRVTCKCHGQTQNLAGPGAALPTRCDHASCCREGNMARSATRDAAGRGLFAALLAALQFPDSQGASPTLLAAEPCHWSHVQMDHSTGSNARWRQLEQKKAVLLCFAHCPRRGNAMSDCRAGRVHAQTSVLSPERVAMENDIRTIGRSVAVGIVLH